MRDERRRLARVVRICETLRLREQMRLGAMEVEIARLSAARFAAVEALDRIEPQLIYARIESLTTTLREMENTAQLQRRRVLEHGVRAKMVEDLQIKSNASMQRDLAMAENRRIASMIDVSAP